MQVTKARTSVCWEPSGVCFGKASMMTLQNVWQNVPFAKRKLHLSARNPLCKKKFRRAWHTISADFFDLMEKEYLLVTVHFSKFPFVKCLPWDCSRKTTQETLKALFSVQGVPEMLYTDNGLQFVTCSFAEFCDEWNVRHITSSPHYPQSNGFIESMVKAIKKTLPWAQSPVWTPKWPYCACAPHPWATHCPLWWRCWWAARLS